MSKINNCKCGSSDLSLENYTTIGGRKYSIFCKGCHHRGPHAENKEKSIKLWNLYNQPDPYVDALQLSIKEQLEEKEGAWRSCSGCCEHIEGVSQGEHSDIFQCDQGNGCSECGGIGVVWDNTDYNLMADEYIAEEREIERLKACIAALQSKEGV